MKKILIFLLIIGITTPLSAFSIPTFGQFKRVSGALLGFKVNRNNIPGADFTTILPGLCLYDDNSLEENNFTIGGGDFPDLLIDRNLRVNAEFQATANSFHVGTFKIQCTFKKLARRLHSARCTVNFYSPARPDIQLDSCTADATFRKVVRGDPRR